MAQVVQLRPPPPHDLDAEASVISAVTLKPDTFEAVAECVQPHDFYSDANRRIAETIWSLRADGAPLDITMIAARLRADGRLEQIGGTPYLAQLIDATPAVANAPEHARIVADRARARRLIAACKTIAAEAEAGAPLSELLERASVLAEDAKYRQRAPVGFRVVDGAELWAPLQDPEYVVEGVIRRGSLNEIVAYGSSGKSWLAVDLAASVAAGAPWLGLFPTKQGRTAYLDYENGSYEMRRRTQGVAAGRQLRTPIVGLDVSCMPDSYMSEPAFPSKLKALAEGRALIIVDTLRAADPLVDENDSTIRVGLDHMRRVGETTGCAFVVLVHAKKTSGNATTIDPREAGRGSSAIFDAADAVFHVQYTEGSPLRVVQTKARLGRTVTPFLVRIDDVPGGVRVWAENEALTASQASGSASAKFDEVCTQVLEAVRKHPGASKRLLAEKAGKRFATVAAALENLQRNGAVTPNGDRWFPVTRKKDCDG